MILYSAFFIGFLLSGARRYSVGFDAGFWALLAVVIEVVTAS